MATRKDETKLAEDERGKIVHVDNAERGRDYFCRGCN